MVRWVLMMVVFSGLAGVFPTDTPTNAATGKTLPSAGFGDYEAVSWEEIESPEGFLYGANGTLETENRVFRYGFSKRLADGDYDGLLVVLDKTTGEVLETCIYATGYWETFLFMGELADGSFVLAVLRYEVPGESAFIEKHDTVLLKVDANGTILIEKCLPKFQKDFHNHGGMLIVQESRNSTEMTVYDEFLEESVLPDIPETVNGPFSYPFIGTATVNGEAVAVINLTFPGKYEVLITHETYSYAFSFSLDPVVTGIEEGGQYLEPRIISSEGYLELDGEPFVSGTAVSVPGYHRLAIRGINGYEKNIDFTIHPVVENLELCYVSAQPVEVFSNGISMTLDGMDLPDGTMVWQAGEHLLRVEGSNGYFLEIPFTILPSLSGIEDGGIYEGSVIFQVNGEASLDGKTLTAETTEVITAGEHEVVLWLGTERVETIRFSIQEIPESLPEETPQFTYPFLETGLGIIALIGLFLVLKKK